MEEKREERKKIGVVYMRLVLKGFLRNEGGALEEARWIWCHDFTCRLELTSRTERSGA